MSILATVIGGRIETDTPLDIKDGTEVSIAFVNGRSDEESGWDNSPEGIASWLEWADSLEPLIFTAAEQQAWEMDRETRKEWEKAHSQEYSQELKRVWE